MKQIRTNVHIIAELPKEVVKTVIAFDKLIGYSAKTDTPLCGGKRIFEHALPKGHTYTLLGKVPELTEHWIYVGEPDDSGNYYDHENGCYSLDAEQSLHSYLRSKGMNPDNTIVIKEN